MAEVDERDVQVESYHAGSRIAQMRMVHLPTGIIVDADPLERSQHRQRQKMLAEIGRLLSVARP